MKYYVLIYFLFASHFALSQDTTQNPKYHYDIGYFGEKVFHPGLQLTASFALPLNNSIFFKDRVFVGMSVVGYAHAPNHVGLRLTPTATFFHETKSGMIYGLGGDIGYMRRTYQGKVFQVDSNGNVKQERFAGQSALTYGIHLRMAKVLQQRNSKPFQVFIQPGIFWERNYSNGNIAHPFISVGYNKQFSKKNENN